MKCDFFTIKDKISTESRKKCIRKNNQLRKPRE